MLSIKVLSKYDRERMFKIYDNWPTISSDSYFKSNTSFEFKRINEIIFAGMGGSGIVGEFMSTIMSKSGIRASTITGDQIPKNIAEKTLVITTSISGSTRETLTILKKAFNHGCKIVGFSSGGKMLDFCLKHRLPHQKIQLVHSPRASLPSAIYSMLAVLGSDFEISKSDVKESLNLLKKTARRISSENLSKNNEALSLASKMKGTPVIYYSNNLHPVALRFKNSLQENTKIHVMIENVIEMCHNGIVSWETQSSFQPILIQDIQDNLNSKRIWSIIKKYFKENKINFNEIRSVKGNIISRLINLIFVLDYTSIYRAVLNRTDPSPIRSVNYIKSRL